MKPKLSTLFCCSLALLLLFGAGCGGGECAVDGDCQSGYRCSDSSGLFYGDSICVQALETIVDSDTDVGQDVGQDVVDQAVARLRFVTDPPAQHTAGQPFDIAVQLVDASGEALAIAGHDLTLSLSKNSFGDEKQSLTTTTNADGVALFAAVTITTAATNYRLHVSLASITSSSARFDVVASEPDAETSSIDGGRCVQADGHSLATIHITLRDAFGNPVTGQTPTFEAGGLGNASSPCSPTNAAGASVCQMSSTHIGGKPLRLTSPVTLNGGHVSFSRSEVVASEHHAIALKSNCTLSVWGQNISGQAAPQPGLSDVVAVAVGDFHSMALLGDGSLRLWGDNFNGQRTPPPGLSEIVAISAGRSHSLALTADGSVVGWGLDNFGQAKAPEGLSDIIAIAAGSQHNLALKADGTVVAWGRNNFGQLNQPAGLSDVVAIATSAGHSLALKADGTVVAWGQNDFGQSTPPALLNDVIAIDAGGFHSLALRADGTVVAWGIDDASRNDFGQTSVPDDLDDVISIGAGGTNSLALKANGHIVGWGDDGQNQSSGHVLQFSGTNGELSFELEAPSSLAAGERFDVTVRARRLSNPEGPAARIYVRLGLNHHGFADSTSELIAITDDEGIARFFEVAINAASDDYHLVAKSGALLSQSATFAVTPLQPDADQSSVSGARCVPADGQTDAVVDVRLRDRFGNSITTLLPTLSVSGDGNVLKGCTLPDAQGVSRCVLSSDTAEIKHVRVTEPVAITAEHRLAFVTGRATLSAHASHNLVLHGDCTVTSWGRDNRAQTIVPLDLSDVAQVAAGAFHSLALGIDGSVSAWGWNAYSQITVPAGLDDVVAVAAGGFHSLALKADGTVVAWGRNDHGESSVPAALFDIVAIAAGYQHSVAIRADGAVFGWGLDTNNQTTVPLAALGAVEIVAGWYHNIVRKSDGSYFAWGRVAEGQSTLPDDMSDVIALSAGRRHSLALKADGTLLAWGTDTEGQITLPDDLTDVVAIAAGEDHSIAAHADGTTTAWGSNLFGQIEPQ
ncbi:MAG: Ig-like domain-containing protein [Bradymonadaceae bacterium]|nr:Ig-like domain-containing protein [Lujinxingiaceae bacterium]